MRPVDPAAAPVDPAAAPVDDGGCYACGTTNPHGLNLRFEPVGADGARGRVTLAGHLQGYRGIAHGGIVMLLLDEVMAHAAGNAGDAVVTASVAVRFRGPVPLEVPVDASARIVSRRGKVLKIEAAVVNLAGELLASAEGAFVRTGAVEPGRFGNFAQRQPV